MKNFSSIISVSFFLIISTFFIQCDNDSVIIKEVVNISALQHSWDIAIPNQNIPEGLTSLSSEECGSCHQNHYKEWKLSTHSLAWRDLQFQAELKKESSPFMCINCHIPLQNQQEYIILGLENGNIYRPVKEKNTFFDKKLQQEGINCASCHVRDGAVIGTIGSDKAPHKVVKDPEFLSEKLCISCHNAVAIITKTLACSFETGDEWKAGPFFGKKNCISCHMKIMERELVTGFGVRKSHFHSFPGSGIPKFDTVLAVGLNGLGIYPSALKTEYNLGDSISYRLKLKNEFAGHKVPTGDPERFFIISFDLINKTGDTLLSKQERIGEHWEWHPKAKKVFDNNLLPQEERLFSFFYLPKKKASLILKVKVSRHRMTKATALYNDLGDSYPLFIPVFSKEYKFSVK